MTSDRFLIFLSWTPREEEATKILGRMRQSVQALSEINSVFGSLKVFDMIEALKRHSGGAKKRARDGVPVEPQAPSGFMVIAAKEYGYPEDLSLRAGNAGRKTLPGMCGVTFSTGKDQTPDPAIVSLAMFKAIILALVPIWQATYAQTYPVSLQRQIARGGSMFWPTWMTWLAPELAKDFVPSRAFTVEQLADGGAFLIATQETFDIENPEHVVAAKAIEAALVPVEKKLLLN